MTENNSINDSISLEYELIEILFEQEELSLHSQMVCDDSELLYSPIEYDENGIPKGNSREEIKMREKSIKDFYARWIEANPSKRVWNENLKAYIFVKFKSINETYAKAARTYESTCAVFLLDEILKTSILVKEMIPKKNENQRPYEKMLQMQALGNVKLIVGLQRSTQEHVQYSITVPEKK